MQGSDTQPGTCMGCLDQAPDWEVLECRELEISNAKAELTSALLVIEAAKDMRTRLHAVDGSGEATIYFSAALADFQRLRGVPCG